MARRKSRGCRATKQRTLYLIDGCNLTGEGRPNPDQVEVMLSDLVRTLPPAIGDQIFLFVDGGNSAFLFAAQELEIGLSLKIGHGPDGADKKMSEFAADLERLYCQGFSKIIIGSADRCFEELLHEAKAIGFETTLIVSLEGEKTWWVREADHVYCLDGRRLSGRKTDRTTCTRQIVSPIEERGA